MKKLTFALLTTALLTASAMAKEPSDDLVDEVSTYAFVWTLCPQSSLGQSTCEEKIRQKIQQAFLADGFSYSTARTCRNIFDSDYKAKACGRARIED
ncbi:hypothetical protein ACHELOUS_182 [Vibrio phage Achelous]|uniref:Uncharacterized protein n=1 Tax=Vibrio phage Achelous TaxID=2576872 RepID=A0A4P8N4M6_9CAUD|nr:hypothetical protein KNU52_gp113 [Vibrio phage Achelous]QCQ57757.1 hypothetical protein ACHELOUS_182 [Vibrio phage Achelous]